MNHVHLTGLLARVALTDDPEVLAELHEAIESGEVNFVDYISDTLRHCDELNMTLAGIDSEIERLNALKLERVLRAKRLHGYVQYALEQIGQTQWLDTLHTVLLKRNPPKVVIESEAIIPREYIREVITTTEKVDKVAIKEALTNGIPVEGCKLVQEWRMEIK